MTVARTHDLDHPRGVRKVVPPSEADQLDAFAQLGTSDNFETLLPDIQRAVRAILMVQGRVSWWQVRLALYRVGKVGTEEIRGGGTFARRCGLVALRDEEGMVKAERPSPEYNELFPKSHANRHTCYGYPTTVKERTTKIEQALG